MRRICLLFTLWFLFTILHSFGLRAETIRDAFGVEFEARQYSRIVSLAPNLTEIVAYLGKLDNLVGVTTYCDFPPEVKKLRKIGGFIDPNVESIVMLKPDIVLAYRGNPLPAITKLKEIGIPVFVQDSPTTMDELQRQIERIAKLLYADQEAFKKLAGIRELLSTYRVNLKPKRMKPTVLIFTNNNPPFYCAGRNTIHDSLIAYAGGVNGFLVKGYAQISPEAILKVNPSLIVFPLRDKSDQLKFLTTYQSLSYFAKTKAFNGGSIVFEDENSLLRPGPRLFRILEVLTDKVSEVSSR